MVKENIVFALVAAGIVLLLISIALCFRRPERGRMHNGKCDIEGCERDGTIFLDGRQILCWEHYGERMRKIHDDIIND